MRKQGHDLFWLNATNLDALHAAVLAAEDSNSGFRGFQKSGEIFAHGFVGAVFDGGGLDSDLERSIDDAGDFVAAGARLNANMEDHAAVARVDVELLSGVGTRA